MPFLTLLIAITGQGSMPYHHEWDAGSPVLSQHPNDFDISIARFEYRATAEERTGTMRTTSSRPATTIFTVDRFTVLDSTRRARGETLDAVSTGSVGGKCGMPEKGKNYLLITRPQEGGKVVYPRVVSDNAALDTFRTEPLAIFPANSPNEEVCEAALPTPEGRLSEQAGFDYVVPLSVAACLHSGDRATFLNAFSFLWFSGDPGPDAHKDPVNGYHPENPASVILRREANLPGTTLTVRVALYQVLNAWFMAGTMKPLIDGFADAARDRNACPQGPFIHHVPLGEAGLYRPRPAFIIRAVDHATNMPMVAFFLRVAPNMSLEQDKKLTVWLDSPDEEVRFQAAAHFAKSRKRPDLMPVDIAPGPGRISHPDLAEKVAAWKQFFKSAARRADVLAPGLAVASRSSPDEPQDQQPGSAALGGAHRSDLPRVGRSAARTQSSAHQILRNHLRHHHFM